MGAAGGGGGVDAISGPAGREHPASERGDQANEARFMPLAFAGQANSIFLSRGREEHPLDVDWADGSRRIEVALDDFRSTLCDATRPRVAIGALKLRAVLRNMRLPASSAFSP